ncbi:FAD-dependent monooxygenase [Actinokineospora spheciospongiae]|uniref:FAD-dependent monooxygenase n=1 Tax=Actinokineospora spheciospongiae TaxID=909613 RepID=UPI000D70A461|nr:FAD-dependent monooxygenase [Actinokineospora spheciospongiae]PWW53029.1 2-polyprenyl-6-methoxyphenol hydroxylase-like FAD-dependent oxidoreductase [Actinokineospora spheciospongiae]
MSPTAVDVCVVGGGPAGLALGLELARQGVEVAVVEQSGHFNRSFRGESVSPDAVLVLDRLGVLDKIKAEGALTTTRMEITEDGRTVLDTAFADFEYEHRFPLELPQPTLLGVMDNVASGFDNFSMLRKSTVVGLLEADGAVTGVRIKDPGGERELAAKIVIGADGRYSKVLEMSGLAHERVPLDRDVVWLKLPLPPEWDTETYRVRIKGDRHGLFIPTYPDMVRVGFNIPKGGLRELRKQGIGALHEKIDELAPELSTLVREKVTGYSDTSMLDIFTSVVPRWSRDGLLVIGDAAHTLSPVLGQGVNHALIDAVTLAPMLTAALKEADHRTALAAAAVEFQRIREPEVKRSRGLQLRQERMFTFGSRAGVFLRSSLYRAMNRSAFLKQRVLADAYFRLQKREKAA